MEEERWRFTLLGSCFAAPVDCFDGDDVVPCTTTTTTTTPSPPPPAPIFSATVNIYIINPIFGVPFFLAVVWCGLVACRRISAASRRRHHRKAGEALHRWVKVQQQLQPPHQVEEEEEKKGVWRMEDIYSTLNWIYEQATHITAYQTVKMEIYL